MVVLAKFTQIIAFSLFDPMWKIGLGGYWAVGPIFCFSASKYPLFTPTCPGLTLFWQ
jgi:hypothetical protein